MRIPRSVLVLYTGGTIGMQMSAEGLAPASGFDVRARAAQSRFAPALDLDWHLREIAPLIDSANMTPTHWLTMRDAIVAAVECEGYDAVLVLHGTDTLAYSAAALTFLLMGLPAPVLLTGSMQPAGVEGSDAWPNFFGALAALQSGQTPGVQLYFNGQCLHGARAVKLSSERRDAFVESSRPRNAQAVSIPETLDYRVPRQVIELAVVPVFPGINARYLQTLVDSGVKGLVLECYGSGTGPADDSAWLAVLQRAHERGVVMLAISQCQQGAVAFDVYAAGSRLAACGVISGGGMTREAALAKLFAVLGTDLCPAQARQWLTRDWCGEMNDHSVRSQDEHHHSSRESL